MQFGDTMQAAASGRMFYPDGRLVAYKDVDTNEIRRLLKDARITPALRDKLTGELAVREARADVEFRDEVVEALMAEGKARHVALSLTDSETKLLAQARRTGVL